MTFAVDRNLQNLFGSALSQFPTGRAVCLTTAGFRLADFRLANPDIVLLLTTCLGVVLPGDRLGWGPYVCDVELAPECDAIESEGVPLLITGEGRFTTFPLNTFIPVRAALTLEPERTEANRRLVRVLYDPSINFPAESAEGG